MSEQTTTVRTDELRPGDRVWHPFDLVCFTVAHEPKPETGLHFEGQPGLRVTGTTDRGETVYVDVAPAYKWHRGPKATAPTTHDPLVANTKDGTCWVRRAVTRDGHGLYAVAGAVKGVPDEVLATLPELAEHGIVGSADVLPVPVGPEPQPLALPWAHAMSDEDLHGFLGDLVSAAMGRWQSAPEVPDRTVLANVEKACAEWRRPGQGYRSDESEVDALLARVAELEAERHTTNEALSDAAEQLRADRDRIAELERQLAAKDRPADEDPIAFALTNRAVVPAGFCRNESPYGRRCDLTAGHDGDHAMADGAGGHFGWPASDDDVRPQVRKLKQLLAGQRDAVATEAGEGQ